MLIFIKRPMLRSRVEAWNHFISSKLKLSKLYRDLLLILSYLGNKNKIY